MYVSLPFLPFSKGRRWFHMGRNLSKTEGDVPLKSLSIISLTCLCVADNYSSLDDSFNRIPGSIIFPFTTTTSVFTIFAGLPATIL